MRPWSCKNCGQPIMEFDFAESKQWWHLGRENTTYLLCACLHNLQAEPND